MVRRRKHIAADDGSWNSAITIHTDPGVATALSLAPFQSFGSEEQVRLLGFNQYSSFDGFIRN